MPGVIGGSHIINKPQNTTSDHDKPQNTKQEIKNIPRTLNRKLNMSPRPIVGVLCALCQEHNDKSIEDILCEAPECFKGVLDMSDGYMAYIFQPEDSTVKIFTDSCHSPLYQTKPGSFSHALRMREWLKIRLALCQIEHALSGR